jgi:acid stress-induced BolA-like protein IbaG/YrbA
MTAPSGEPVTPRDIARRIEASLPGARAEVSGADAHFSATIVSEAFAGKTRVEQHQMIYALFREELGSQAIHALALRTLTPQQWGKRPAGLPDSGDRR